MNEIKLKKWSEIEKSINNLFWHIEVSSEAKVELCKGVIMNELNTIKSNFDYIDNF